MAFDVIYPPKGRITYDGGKNNKYEKYLIGENESPDSLNCIYANGAVETRLGSQKFNSTAVGSYVGEGLYTRHTNNGQQSMCAWWNGSLYVAATNTFVTVPSAVSVFTAGGRVGSAEYENYRFFGNGQVIPYKYNGNFTRHGVYPATTTATVASITTSAGSLTGAYVYAYTNVNTNLVESDLSPLAATLTVSLAKVLVSAIATQTVSYGITARNIYRSKTSSTTLFRLATINDNTTTSFVDTVADTALGAEAPSDQGVPPKYSTIITHQTRLFCNDTDEPNLLWFSEIDNPYIFKASNNFLIGDNSGETIRALSVHDNGVLIFTENQAYLLYMPDTDPDNWSVVRLISSYGSKSPHGIFSYNDKQAFPAIQNNKLVGFGAMSGNSVDPEATYLSNSKAGSDLTSDRIEPDVFLMQSVNYERISAIVHKNKAYVAVTYGDGNTQNNRVYVFDFSITNLSKDQEFSWEPWTGLSAEQFTIFNGELYSQDSTATGFVRQLNKAGTYSDDGAAINSYHWTKEFDGLKGSEQVFKDFRYTNLLYEKAGGYFMDLFYRVDSDSGDGTKIQVDLDPGSSLWGAMVWGVDSWGGGNAAGEEKIFLGQLRGKRIQFKFSNQNTAGQKFKVYGQQFGYNDVGRR
jgi:hypothetical protein